MRAGNSTSNMLYSWLAIVAESWLELWLQLKSAGFSSYPHGPLHELLGFLLAWLLGSKSEKIPWKSPLCGLVLQFTYPLYHTLLVKSVKAIHQESRGKDTDWIPWHKSGKSFLINSIQDGKHYLGHHWKKYSPMPKLVMVETNSEY